MKNNRRIGIVAIILLSHIICLISCERTEIKPEVSGTSVIPDAATNISPADRLVGTWVRYWDSNIHDTLKFSADGTFVYISGNYFSNGDSYIKDYYYECTDNYLIRFNNPSDIIHQTHFLEFYYNETVFTLHNFTFIPVGIDLSYSVTFKKID